MFVPLSGNVRSEDAIADTGTRGLNIFLLGVEVADKILRADFKFAPGATEGLIHVKHGTTSYALAWDAKMGTA